MNNFTQRFALANAFTIVALCFGLLLSSDVLAQADRPTFISGKVVGANGKPMKTAHVFASQFNSANEKPKTFKVNADGSYGVYLPPGWYELEFAGVDHQQDHTPSWVYCCAKEMRIDARLQANTIDGEVDSVAVITDNDKYNFAKARLMKKQSDGTFVIDVECMGETLGYQVIVYTKNTTEPHSMNGTSTGNYQYDGGGDYRSLIAAKDGVAHIVFDPRQFPKKSSPSSVVFVDEFSKEVAAIVDAQQQVWAQFFSESAKQQGGMEFSYDAFGHRAALRKKIEATKDQHLRQLLMMSYLSVPSFSKDSTGADPKFVDLILETIPPASPMWTNYPNIIADAVRMSSKPKGDYIQRMLNEHASESLKAQILFNQIVELYEQKKFDVALPLYNKLVKEYPDTYAAQQAQRELRPNSKIKVGNMIPDFAFATVDDSTVRYIPATLKGRWVLIDNWATWCGPCVREMENLHKAYENFKDKRFTILSVSFDRSVADIEKFRKGKWPMPWLHCYSPGVWQNEATKVFEVSGIPKPILIDPDGRIVALDEDLRGARLEQTLKKFMP